LRKETDVIICGGGPAGLLTAALAARGGLEVVVLEEHERVGVPAHCAGILGWRCWESLPYRPREAVVEETREISFIFPEDKVDLTMKKPAVIVNRAVFDAKLAEEALRQGAEVVTEARALGGRELGDGVKVCVKLREGVVFIRGKYLVGADGARSIIRKMVGERMSFDIGVQLIHSRKGCSSLEVYFTPPLPPGYFGWRIPFGELEKIGVVAPLHRGRLLWKFSEKVFTIGEISHIEGGLIPRRLVRKMARGRVALVGDSAGQVKPISRGGIFLGSAGAITLSEALLAGEKLETYEKRWRRRFLMELEAGLALRRILESLSWHDLRKVFSMASSCLREHPIEVDLDGQASFIFNSTRTCLPSIARDLRLAAQLIKGLGTAVLGGVLLELAAPYGSSSLGHRYCYADK